LEILMNILNTLKSTALAAPVALAASLAIAVPLFGVGVAVSAAFVPASVHAQGVPVIDARSLLQQLETYKQQLVDEILQEEQIAKLVEQVRLLEDQLAQLEEIQALVSNPSDILGLVLGSDLDGILEGEFDLNMVDTLLRGSKGDWSGLKGAGADAFKERLSAAFEGGGTSQEKVTALANSGNVQAERNATATTAGAATSAAAEVAYEEAAQSVERVEVLVTEIANMESLKESVDHNTRVTAELAIAMAAMWQLESVQTMNVGFSGVLDAATLADIEKFNDFTQPEF
jgi:type IV secretion system protein VirB5